jgi:uncharacterized protein
MAISVNSIKSADWSLKINEFGEVVQGYDDINQSIDIILQTPKGADCFRPLFGADLYKYADQPVNIGGPQMVREIIEALQIWETRIEVTAVNYTVSESAINFSIKWLLVENRQTGVANVALQTAPAPAVSITPPPTPRNLTASEVDRQIVLNWAYDLPAIGSVFQIWRSIDGVNFSFLATQYNSLTYTDAPVAGLYYYKVRAAIGTRFGEFSNISSAEIMPVFEFQTTWDTSTDGAFNPTLTGGTSTWAFGTDEVTGTNPNYSGSYLDGTTKTVIVTNTDFSAVTDINFNSDKIVGDLDLSIITGGDKSFNLSENTGITSVRTGACNLTDFQTNCNTTSALAALHLSDSTCTGDLILTNLDNNLATLELPTGTCTLLQVPRSKLAALNTTGLLLSGAINIGTTTFLTSITFDPAPQTVGTITARGITNVPSFNASQLTVNGQLQIDTGFINVTIGGGNLTRILSVFGNLNIISLGSAIISSATTSVSLNNNGMTTAEVDAVWIELDRVAVATGTARTLNVSGQGAPSVVSESERLNLFLNGYFLIE